MVWTEIEINAKRMLIENIPVLPNKIEQLRFLEEQREKAIAIIILGDFNMQNTFWDKHINQNNKMGIALEELI